ncbi:tail assembly chaperone [Loigolactobacillus coryniformis]|uniref:Uncharacterized protein n=1 Tax=Loigolactobacillus coryniformis subsp. torquens DSM 20004 = KCTC 3535 TaxID=1423822 RepID=A0A2D1KMI6_9LACO|nr:tail assembly chaperone [Loigolactobacillus coryniformis]ATO43328.1 hypothetical protein LC20004_05145 [Loigolactobacillus coryniformis subsp. torquens DSM 20004 = KCTC 3535]KRK85641.1 hypothetical protein FC16_GL000033 [Loigolactobacillus coryniformis subsp. torquens DSM 20004 = KCTC 3535]
MEFKIGPKSYEIKFNYNAMFKANKEYSDIDKAGNSMNNGAANLFMRLISNDDTVLFDILKLYVDKKVTDERVLDAVDALTDGGKKIDEIHTELVEELKNSGFFSRAIESYKKTIEDGLEMLKKKDQTEDNENNIMAVERQLTLLNENL